MCLSGGSSEPPEQHVPAAAPAAPLPPADEPGIGEGRERENKANFGDIRGPDYRIRTDDV